MRQNDVKFCAYNTRRVGARAEGGACVEPLLHLHASHSGYSARLYYTHKSRPHAYSHLKGVAHSHDDSVALGILHIALWEKR